MLPGTDQGAEIGETVRRAEDQARLKEVIEQSPLLIVTRAERRGAKLIGIHGLEVDRTNLILEHAHINIIWFSWPWSLRKEKRGGKNACKRGIQLFKKKSA